MKQNKWNRYNNNRCNQENVDDNKVNEVGIYENIVGNEWNTDFKYFENDSGLCNILHIIIKEIENVTELDEE